MAYRTALRLSRKQQCTTFGRVTSNGLLFSEQLPAISLESKYHSGNDGNNNGHQGSNDKWGQSIKFGAGLGIAAAVIAGLPGGVLLAEDKKEQKVLDKERSFKAFPGVTGRTLLAEEDNEESVKSKEASYLVFPGVTGHTLMAEEGAEQGKKDKEGRIRKTQTLDKIFDYFSTYRYINQRGKNVNLMSIKDFYNAVTPGSSITHGTGLTSSEDYIKVTDSDITSDKLFLSCEIPVANSILNKIQQKGLLSYTDFCFLMNILATPFRYLDIAFLAFDITGDGEIEAKEFLKVMTHITKHTGGAARYDDCGTPDEVMKSSYSGLMNYFFGTDRKKKMGKDEFRKFRGRLIDEMLWLEFSRYCKSLPELPNLPQQSEHFQIITDVEFCEHLLAHANLPPNKKEKMIKRVTKFYGESSKNPSQLAEGITYSMFKRFYHLLYCGADLERSMAFIEAEKGGVTREEFVELSKNISDVEVDSHMLDIVYLMFDEDEDNLLTLEEFAPLLADWRLSRSLMQASTKGAAILDLKLS